MHPRLALSLSQYSPHSSLTSCFKHSALSHVPCFPPGHEAKPALERSKALMAGLRSSYGWPFVALILGVRLIDLARNAVLTAIPPRWWQDVIEVPVLITLLMGFAKLVIIR